MQHTNYENVTFIGTGLSKHDAYHIPERACWDLIAQQISKKFAGKKNLLISLTWFGPQFDNDHWEHLVRLNAEGKRFDNIFFLATVDPPCLNVTELQTAKNLAGAVYVYYLGNFDSPHQFNFFSIQLGQHFKCYAEDEVLLESVQHLYVNYNRKPKMHRVQFVKKLIAENLLDLGVVTLGQDSTNDLYLTLGEKQQDYVGDKVENFKLPMDYYTLHRLDLWQKTFLYINAATEFDPINDLFCQQDTFKPMLGLRPFVINGVQKTYQWLRYHGFRTFNHYWSHIDIENGPVHDTIIELIKHLKSLDSTEILAMYQDMLPDLKHNKDRFFEFAQEQKFRMEHLFELSPFHRK